MQTFLWWFNVVFNVCGVCLVLTGFQKVIYNQCGIVVVGETEAREQDYEILISTQPDWHDIWADLVTRNDKDDSLIILRLYWNVEMMYSAVIYTDLALLASEFMYPECSSSVAMTYAPFSYPYYSDLNSSWTRAAEEVRDLRNEIESVRSVRGEKVVYEENLDRLAEVYDSIKDKFYHTKSTMGQLSVIEANFQNTLRTFPYNVATWFVPRLKLNLLSEAVEEINACDIALKKGFVFVFYQDGSEDEDKSLKDQQEQNAM